VISLDQGGSRKRRTRFTVAPRDLDHIVESTFVSRDVDSPRSWRIVPDPSAHLLFAVERSGNVRAGIVGARSTFADIDPSHRRVTVGVRFRPGVLAAFARDRADAFTDRAVPIDDALGPAWRPLVDRVAEQTPEEALAAILDAIRARAVTEPRWTRALTSARSVAEGARAAGMALRTFHARTQEALGLPPKRLLRIQRLHRALANMSKGWATVAADAGYTDQPHLVRDMVELVGETPTQWRKRGLADSYKTDASARD
jgi:AraC-like DNA-binding protein